MPQPDEAGYEENPAIRQTSDIVTDDKNVASDDSSEGSSSDEESGEDEQEDSGSDDDEQEHPGAMSRRHAKPARSTLLSGGPKSEHERDFDTATAEADETPVVFAATLDESADGPGPARSAGSVLHFSAHDRVVVARAAPGTVTLDEGTVLLTGRQTTDAPGASNDGGLEAQLQAQQAALAGLPASEAAAQAVRALVPGSVSAPDLYATASAVGHLKGAGSGEGAMAAREAALQAERARYVPTAVVGRIVEVWGPVHAPMYTIKLPKRVQMENEDEGEGEDDGGAAPGSRSTPLGAADEAA